MPRKDLILGIVSTCCLPIFDSSDKYEKVAHMQRNSLLFPTIEVLFSMAMILMFMLFAMGDLRQIAPASHPSLFLSLGVGAICFTISYLFFKQARKLAKGML
jgi:hypothetical protein